MPVDHDAPEDHLFSVISIYEFIVEPPPVVELQKARNLFHVRVNDGLPC